VPRFGLAASSLSPPRRDRPTTVLRCGVSSHRPRIYAPKRNMQVRALLILLQMASLSLHSRTVGGLVGSDLLLCAACVLSRPSRASAPPCPLCTISLIWTGSLDILVHSQCAWLTFGTDLVIPQLDPGSIGACPSLTSSRRLLALEQYPLSLLIDRRAVYTAPC
jgi:hypothetical protein